MSSLLLFFKKYKRARVSLTLRLICGYLLRSLLPFLTGIYETLLDLEINKTCSLGQHSCSLRSKPGLLSWRFLGDVL